MRCALASGWRVRACRRRWSRSTLENRPGRPTAEGRNDICVTLVALAHVASPSPGSLKTCGERLRNEGQRGTGASEEDGGKVGALLDLWSSWGMSIPQ